MKAIIARFLASDAARPVDVTFDIVDPIVEANEADDGSLKREMFEPAKVLSHQVVCPILCDTSVF